MTADHADREALVDAFLASLRALLLAGLAEGRAPPAPDRSGRTLRVKHVAARYDVETGSVYKWIGAGRLPGLRLPCGDYRFRDEDLAEFDRRRACITGCRRRRWC